MNTMMTNLRRQFMKDVMLVVGSERFKAARDYAKSIGGNEFDVVKALKGILQGDDTAMNLVIRLAKRQDAWERAVPSMSLLMHEDDSDDDMEDFVNELKGRPRLPYEDVPDEEVRQFLETLEDP